MLTEPESLPQGPTARGPTSHCLSLPPGLCPGQGGGFEEEGVRGAQRLQDPHHTASHSCQHCPGRGEGASEEEGVQRGPSLLLGLCPGRGGGASKEEGVHGAAMCLPVVWQWITRMLAISANLTLEGFFFVSFRNSPRTTSHLQ